MTRVLVVDDDPHIVRTLRIHLSAHGYTVETAADGRGAIRTADAVRPDVVVLDLGLPDVDGIMIIPELHRSSSVPIIVLSARTDAGDKVDALDAGADDYVTKPFHTAELLARIRAAVRRPRLDSPAGTDLAEPEQVVRTAAFTVDLVAKKVHRGGTEVRLTPTEWAILEILIRQRGALVPHRRLLAEVWGPQYRAQTNYLRVYVGQLRQKLEPEPSRPRFLITEPGMGYRFEPPRDPTPTEVGVQQTGPS